MAFLSRKELEQLLPSCVEQFKPERIAEAAYELCLGNEVYLTDSTSGKKELLDEKNSQVEIRPGQFALLLTEETVKIPLDKIAFISIKFSQKIKGLVNISGFHVDPGFDGKIIFSVYNAGPTTIVLDKGKPYFMIWFSELTSSAIAYNGKHQKQTGISAEQVSSLKGELASPKALLKQIQDLEKKVDLKIEELKGKKDYNKWVLQAMVAVLLGLFVKQWMDNDSMKKGYEYGLNAKSIKEEIKQVKIDSLVSTKVDSILKFKRLQNDTTR